jgi:4-hydroxythreonine-4-phosphate dehydrogenase
MMLVGGGLRVALATTHLALSTFQAIRKNDLVQTLRVIHSDLQKRFHIARPRILVAGLNPHSGEGGHFGHEDADEIAPAIAEAKPRASTRAARCRPTRCSCRTG